MIISVILNIILGIAGVGDAMIGIGLTAAIGFGVMLFITLFGSHRPLSYFTKRKE